LLDRGQYALDVRVVIVLNQLEMTVGSEVAITTGVGQVMVGRPWKVMVLLGVVVALLEVPRKALPPALAPLPSLVMLPEMCQHPK
jgi:hypothetical protein